MKAQMHVSCFLHVVTYSNANNKFYTYEIEYYSFKKKQESFIYNNLTEMSCLFVLYMWRMAYSGKLSKNDFVKLLICLHVMEIVISFPFNSNRKEIRNVIHKPVTAFEPLSFVWTIFALPIQLTESLCCVTI